MTTAAPLTKDNILTAVQGVCWRRLGEAVLLKQIIRTTVRKYPVISYPTLDKIGEEYQTGDDRLDAVVTTWLHGDGEDKKPSWRHLIWKLDRRKMTTVADNIRHNAEPVNDHSLTVENVTQVMGEVKNWGLVGDRLGVPYTKQQELGEYWVKTDPDASWQKLCTALYIEGEESAAAMARQYLAKDFTLSTDNLMEVMKDEENHWEKLGIMLDVPLSKLLKIESLCQSDHERMGAVLDYYVRYYPLARWEHFAQKLQEINLPKQADEVTTKYVKDEEAARKLFNEAMKKGYVESRAIVLWLIGAAGAGKSHFKHLILRLPPPAVRESTPLAEAAIRAISFCRATIGDGGMQWQLVSSEELLRMVAGAIKAGVPIRYLPPANSPVNVLPLDAIANYSDRTPTKQRTQQDGSSSQPSSNTQHSTPPTSSLDRSSSPKSTSSTLESLDLSEPSPTQLEAELVDLISQSSGSRKLFDVDWVYIVDSGGQPQFHEILPAFVHHASACVFIARLDESLTDHPTIEYYGQGGQRHGTPYRSLLTHEQILQHCFQALQSRQCASSSPQSGPMVFVAGTHKDQEHNCPETRGTKNKKLLESLRPVFGDKLGLYRLGEPDQLIFPVNAKTPSREDEKVASEFRKIVTTSCLHEREKIPIPWFVLEQLVRQYVTEKGVSIVSMKQCRQLAQRLHMDDKTFRAALDYLVALNIFHFYPTILPNVVFCDTQVLLDKISELVEYSHMLRGSSDATSRMQSHSGGWLRFRDEGIITVNFLEEFPKHYVAGVFTPSDLLKLLRALLIAAHLAGSEYFMPSLLYELRPDELDHYRCGLTSFPSPLLVHYPGGWMPCGIFTSLIAYLQNVCSWELLLKCGKPVCLRRNCIKFRHPGGRPGSVTLIDSFTHFEVHLASSTPISLASSTPVSRVLCSKIHRSIFDGLEQAADTLSYTNLHPKEAFFCSAEGKDCEPGLHLADVKADGWWSCSTNPEVGGELTEGQALWISSAEDKAQVKAEEYQPPNPPGLPKPHPKPHPSLRAEDPHERIPCFASVPQKRRLSSQAKSHDWAKRSRMEPPTPNLKELVMVNVKSWYNLGLQLDIKGDDLDMIESNRPREQESCKRDMFNTWLRKCPQASYQQLVQALVVSGDVREADRLCRKYGIDMPQSRLQ